MNMEKIIADFSKLVGKIKPMNAVNNIPSSPRTELRRERAKLPSVVSDLTEANVPFSRYHDTGGAFGGCKYVDIPNVFRNFDADENNPDNYDFTFTDWLVKMTIDNGVKPFYRLGVTIENDCTIKAYHIYPPKDYKKWARICEHIIMHYNEGWADGFYYNIEYWEIWNEPDNQENPLRNSMWQGTKEQYFELYEVASNHLKKRFPNLKIGGYSSCGFYKVAEIAVNPEANISDDFNYFFDFFHAFMKHITSEGHESPMDFFSWHSYSSSPQKNAIMSRYVRAQLDEYGYPNCENICNEWNPGIRNNGLLIDASHVGANMISWQKNQLDMAMYYDAQMASSYCGLYDCITYKKTKTFYSFVAFGKLYALGSEIETFCSEQNIQVLGAMGIDRKGLMVVNDGNEDKNVEIILSGVDVNTTEIFVIDNDKNFEKVDFQNKFLIKIPANAIYYFDFK